MKKGRGKGLDSHLTRTLLQCCEPLPLLYEEVFITDAVCSSALSSSSCLENCLAHALSQVVSDGRAGDVVSGSVVWSSLYSSGLTTSLIAALPAIFAYHDASDGFVILVVLHSLLWSHDGEMAPQSGNHCR